MTTSGLSLTAAATYLDSKVTSDFINYTIIGTRKNFIGNDFPYTPKWQVNLDGNYRFPVRSEEHTSELQSLMRISYAVFCLTKTRLKKQQTSIVTHVYYSLRA